MKVALAVLSVGQQTLLGVFVMPVCAGLLCAHVFLAALPEGRATRSWENGGVKGDCNVGTYIAQC